MMIIASLKELLSAKINAKFNFKKLNLKKIFDNMPKTPILML